jgi:hypothetical protein
MNPLIRLILLIGFSLFPTLAKAYYDPVQGRCCSRDPIGEAGGVNLYGIVANSATCAADSLGKVPTISGVREQLLRDSISLQPRPPKP